MFNDAFPWFLNTETKQKRRVKHLAESHLGVPATTARLPAIQGCFSKTVEVSLKSSEQVIIQFRIEPLDMTPFKEAREVLGDLVPDIGKIDVPELEQANIWPFYMNRIPGKPWLDYNRPWTADLHAKCAESLGKIFSCSFVPGESADVTNTVVIPKLREIPAIKRDDICPFFPLAKRLI